MTTKPKSKHPKLSATAEQIRQQLAANNQTLGSVSTYGLPYHELQALTRAENRRRRRERAALTTPSEARRMIYTLAKRRRLLCSLVLTRHKWLEVVEQINPHRFASMSRDSARFQIGRQLARWEACELQERSKTTAAATGSHFSPAPANSRRTGCATLPSVIVKAIFGTAGAMAAGNTKSASASPDGFRLSRAPSLTGSGDRAETADTFT
jgi:hypothetical protein